MNNSYEDLEKRIAARFEREYCLLVGSGTTALYCIFRVIKETRTDINNPEILFPNLTCETAVNSAIFAGMIPTFCDVTPEDYLMCPEALQGELGKNSSIVAVVPTHIFGHMMNIRSLKKAVGKSIVIVEDAAQGYGGAIGALLAGGEGDASILSFGQGKLLDCGSGGALLTDDRALMESARGVARSLSASAEDAATHRTQVMKQMITARKTHRYNRVAHIVETRKILHDHRDGYLAPFDPKLTQPILGALTTIEREIDRRQLLTNSLDSGLARSPVVTLPERTGNPALWRYTFLVRDGSRSERIQMLNQRGINTSKLFTTCDSKFSEHNSHFPVSEKVADSIVNIHFPSTGENSQTFVDTVVDVLANA